jgi:hypothetical protein
MSTQHNIADRPISAKDREFEELLRRAALYAKAQSSTAPPSNGTTSRSVGSRKASPVSLAS